MGALFRIIRQFEKTALSLIIVMMITGTGFCEAPQDVIQVPAFGTAQIQKSDTTSAKNEAVKKAMSKAVETAFFQTMPAESLASEYKNLEAILTGDPSGYVRDYKVIGESSSGKEYRVLINSNILKSKIMASAQTSGAESNDSFPKVLIIVSEKLNPADQQAAAWWIQTPASQQVCENDMAVALLSKKLKSVDHTQAALDETGKQLSLSAAPTVEEMIKMAKAYKADFVITGLVSASDANNTLAGGLKSFPAKADLKILNSADGTEISSASEISSALSSDQTAGCRQAAISAARQATIKLASAASSAAKKPQAQATAAVQATPLKTIPVSINGQDILGKMIPIRSAMTSIKGMKEVKTLEMNYSNAKLQASYDGDPSTLANELALKNFDGFKMEITNTPEAGITINIPEPKAPGLK